MKNWKKEQLKENSLTYKKKKNKLLISLQLLIHCHLKKSKVLISSTKKLPFFFENSCTWKNYNSENSWTQKKMTLLNKTMKTGKFLKILISGFKKLPFFKKIHIDNNDFDSRRKKIKKSKTFETLGFCWKFFLVN